jgi:RHS repeat-associated protein
MVVSSDKKIGVHTGGLTTDAEFYICDVVSSQDYYSFGMVMPGRTFTSSTGYRYGFNGKEEDDEMANVEGAYEDYGFRMYDSRLGRFLSEDPISDWYPYYSPYQFAGNKPIWAIDLEGLEEFFATDRMGKDGTMERHFTRNRNRSERGKKTIQYINISGKSGPVIDITSINAMDQSVLKAFKNKTVQEKYYEIKLKVKKEDEIKKDVTERKPSHKKTDKTDDKLTHHGTDDKTKDKVTSFKVDVPEDIDVEFEPEDDVFLIGKESTSKGEIYDIVKNLITTPGYDAQITIGTLYKNKTDKLSDGTSTAQVLVGQRIEAIKKLIDEVAPPGFDKSRIKIFPVYGPNKKATVKYKESRAKF